MSELDWLWVIGGFGATYGLYRWWKWNDTFLAILEVAPDIDIDDLKQLSSLTTIIDYATVHGLVKTNNSKPDSGLTSQFVANCTGVIQRLIIREQKLKKFVMSETKHLISDVTHYVPFRLVSSKGNFIRIDRPLVFASIKDQLEVTQVKFEPNMTSSIQTVLHTFAGNVPTGIETTEQMLLINTSLTAVGRLEKQSGIWHLIPHEQWGGILTRLSRNEILSNYRTNSSIARFLCILCGTAAICAAVFFYRYPSARQRPINRLPPTAPPTVLPSAPPFEPPVARNEDNNANNRLQCIICLENEVIYSLQPCSHLGLCQTCAQLLQSGSHDQELCPICRAPIQQYQRIFLP